MQFKEVIGNIERKLKKNSGTLCAVGACVGVVATAYFSGKAAVRVDHEVDPDMDKSLKAKTYLKAYWKAGVSGVATCGLIIASDRIHAGNELALAGAAMAIKEKLQKVNEKITEKYGEEATDDIYREMVREDPNIGTRGMDLDAEARSKKLYFYEPISGQAIDTTYEKILEAMLESNLRLMRDFKAEFNAYLEWIGGDAVARTMTYVWDLDDELQNYNSSYCGGFTIDFTKEVNEKIDYWIRSDRVMTPDDRIVMEFLIPPVPEGVLDPKSGVKRPRAEECIDPPWD